MQLIKFKNVTKTFGEVKALENISFEIDKGDFVFITGPSGSGKTTLINLILRQFLPDYGEITFAGDDIAKISQKDLPLYRQKIGTVFQDFKVLAERTLRENIEVALAVIGADESDWAERVSLVLEITGLAKRADFFPSQLSGGELQRASLARALVVNPELILADEPTGNLDWETTSSIIDLFDKINTEGKTIIMATHNKGVLDRIKKRVIELKDGRIVGQEKAVHHKEDNKSKKVRLKVEVS